MAFVQNTAQHQARITQRPPIAFQREDAKLAMLKGVDRSSEARMLARAEEATTVHQRIHWAQACRGCRNPGGDQVCSLSQGM